MQTFLPFKDFDQCAKCLDDKRLYKQIVECKQILNTLEKKRLNPEQKIAWSNHPAVLMWEGYEEALREYQLCMLDEWLKRRWDAELDENCFPSNFAPHALPKWFGDEKLHKSHRANLFFKDLDHYKDFLRDYQESVTMDPDDNDIPKPEYYWPVQVGDEE